MANFINQYWGKARPAGTGLPRWHPAAYHCLDVAAVGQAIVLARPVLGQRIAALAGIAPKEAERLLLLSLALHDLGKFADCFQCLVPEHWCDENRAIWEDKGFGPKALRHGDAGYRLWQDSAAGAVAGALGWEGDAELAFERWLLPMFGHHGRPIADGGGDNRASGIATKKAIADGGDFAAAAAKLLWDGDAGAIAIAREEDLHIASWLIAGLCVMADWIGSNQAWFDYVEPNLRLDDYWQMAQCKARKAVTEAGLVPASAVQSYGVGGHSISKRLAARAPRHCRMGCGRTPSCTWPLPCLSRRPDRRRRTEAALILAHRLMADGAASGLSWRYPTRRPRRALSPPEQIVPEPVWQGQRPLGLRSPVSPRDNQDNFQKSIFREGLKAEGRAGESLSFDGKEETASAFARMAGQRPPPQPAGRCGRRHGGSGVARGPANKVSIAAAGSAFRACAHCRRSPLLRQIHDAAAETGARLSSGARGLRDYSSATLTSAAKNELLTAFAEGAGWVEKEPCETAKSRHDQSFPLPRCFPRSARGFISPSRKGASRIARHAPRPRGDTAGEYGGGGRFPRIVMPVPGAARSGSGTRCRTLSTALMRCAVPRLRSRHGCFIRASRSLTEPPSKDTCIENFGKSSGLRHARTGGLGPRSRRDASDRAIARSRFRRHGDGPRAD